MYTEEELKIMEKQELKEKQRFVKELGQVLVKYNLQVQDLTYDVFTDDAGILYEYLVVTYFGGAIAVRNCRMNSKSAIFREIGNLMDGGKYDEVDFYKSIKARIKKES